MKEAAEIARVLPQSIYLAVSEGRLQSVVMYGKKLIRDEDLQQYLETKGQRNGDRAKKGEQPAKQSRKKTT